jgi:hypothetical protein
LVLALVPAAVPMLVNGRYLASEHQTFGGFLESAHFSPWEYSEAFVKYLFVDRKHKATRPKVVHNQIKSAL